MCTQPWTSKSLHYIYALSWLNLKKYFLSLSLLFSVSTQHFPKCVTKWIPFWAHTRAHTHTHTPVNVSQNTFFYFGCCINDLYFKTVTSQLMPTNAQTQNSVKTNSLLNSYGTFKLHLFSPAPFIWCVSYFFLCRCCLERDEDLPLKLSYLRDKLAGCCD